MLKILLFTFNEGKEMQDMLIFGETVRAPDVRTLFDMREVIADKEWLKTAENIELYYMYRELARNEEELRLIRES